jgi:hypothetical protein
MLIGRIYRPIQSDADHAEQIRKLVRESREALKKASPDTFLGRKTQEPFPKESQTLDISGGRFRVTILKES